MTEWLVGGLVGMAVSLLPHLHRRLTHRPRFAQLADLTGDLPVTLAPIPGGTAVTGTAHGLKLTVSLIEIRLEAADGAPLPPLTLHMRPHLGTGLPNTWPEATFHHEPLDARVVCRCSNVRLEALLVGAHRRNLYHLDAFPYLTLTPDAWVFAHDRKPHLVAAALAFARFMREAPALDLALEALDAQRVLPRRAAFERLCLGWQGEPRAVAAMRPFLDDPDDTCRMWAARALGAEGSPVLMDLLIAGCAAPVAAEVVRVLLADADGDRPRQIRDMVHRLPPGAQADLLTRLRDVCEVASHAYAAERVAADEPEVALAAAAYLSRVPWAPGAALIYARAQRAEGDLRRALLEEHAALAQLLQMDGGRLSLSDPDDQAGMLSTAWPDGHLSTTADES